VSGFDPARILHALDAAGVQFILIGTPSGSSGYRDLQRGAETIELGERLLVQVVGLDDLIRLKRAAGRGKDLVDVAALEEIRALQDESPG